VSHSVSISKVRNPLLSERDGNTSAVLTTALLATSLSETHYSLKEMETLHPLVQVGLLPHQVRNPLLSERDGNGRTYPLHPVSSHFMSETHYSLKEMETYSSY